MRICGRIKEGIAFAFGPPAIPGLGTGSGFTMMLQDRGGNTPDYLYEQTQEFIEAATARPEIGSAITLFRPSSPQIFLDIDDGKALKLACPLADVNTSMGAFLGGAYVNDFNRFGRLYKVYVQAEPEYRGSIDGINMFYVRNSRVTVCPCRRWWRRPILPAPSSPTVSTCSARPRLPAQPAPGYSSAQALDALEEVAAQTLPADMGYCLGRHVLPGKGCGGQWCGGVPDGAGVRVSDSGGTV